MQGNKMALQHPSRGRTHEALPLGSSCSVIGSLLLPLLPTAHPSWCQSSSVSFGQCMLAAMQLILTSCRPLATTVVAGQWLWVAGPAACLALITHLATASVLKELTAECVVRCACSSQQNSAVEKLDLGPLCCEVSLANNKCTTVCLRRSTAC